MIPRYEKYVYTLALDPLTPDTLYAGTDGGIFKTTDGGDSWRDISAGIEGPYTGYISAFAVDPLDPNILYAGTLDGLFKSTSGGETWKEVNLGIDRDGKFLAVYALVIDSSTPSTLYAGISNFKDRYGYGIFKTSDGGENWIPVNTGLPSWGWAVYPEILSLAIDPLKRNTLYSGDEVPCSRARMPEDTGD